MTMCFVCSHINATLECAEVVVPTLPQKHRKPWISIETLNLIDRRRDAALANRFEDERYLRKLVKKSARGDRRHWLISLAGSGSWEAARKLRSPPKHSQGQLNDASGCPVSSEFRAQRFAEFLETVQWKVRPAALTDEAPLHPPLPVDMNPITLTELRTAARKLKVGKSPGPDEKPIEYWKVVLNNASSVGANWLLSFCNMVWSRKVVPDEWHLQRVTLIYKKGDPADCNNYRPICLLQAAYKLFAMILLQRLLSAGADSRIWPSQFGFRPQRGTEDALHCARRAVELAWSQRGGAIHMLALDWRKAFDSISPIAMLQALRRFGLPEPFIEMVASIYSDRRFQVNDCGTASEPRSQHSGICQGCPLSPFLFIIVMTVLMENARAQLSPAARQAVAEHQLYDIRYADDTLILGTGVADVEELASAIEKAGAEFGMTLHWGKTQAMAVCAESGLKDPSGNLVDDTGSLVYLGGLLTADGRADSEVSRRIWAATGDFRALQKMWGHAGISQRRKIHLFHALVASKLQYALSTMWLVTAQQRRIDGFYARCLRRILRIPASYISRVSNKSVFQQAGVISMSEQVLRRQLVLIRKVARSSEGSALRQDVFVGSPLITQVGRYVRRIGRPRQEWSTEVLKAGARKFGSQASFEAALVHTDAVWKEELRSKFSSG